MIISLVPHSLTRVNRLFLLAFLKPRNIYGFLDVNNSTKNIFQRNLRELQTIVSIVSYNWIYEYKKSLQKSLHTQQKKLSSLTKDCNLPIFTANETITNLTQYELSQEESDLLKAGLYFSIQPDKIRKSEIFTTFEKIHRSFYNNLKAEETKSISRILLIVIFTTTNLLHLYYVNIASYETLERIKILL